MPLRPIDNLNLLLDGRSPNWIPFTLDVGAFWGLTPPVLERFRERTGAADPAEYFDFDFRTFSLAASFGGDDPAAWHRNVPPGTTFDEWGIGHVASRMEATVSRTYPPLASAESIREVESFPVPRIETQVDLSAVRSFHERGYAVFGYAGSIYEWSWWLRGMESFLAGLIDEPALVEAIIAKVAGYTEQLALASARAGIDVLCFYDDVGMQTGMQISPAMWRRFIKPKWRQVLEAVRRCAPGTRTFLHSCGHIREIVPDIVELGFDILHPLQPECMDFVEVWREYGRHIALCATISSQRIFPFGKPDDVRREVRRLKDICRAHRRCILCPSNLIQPETPWDNVLAFVEEAKAGRV